MAKKEKKLPLSANAGVHRAMPIILLAMAVFIGICYITQNDTGMLGYAISGVFLGLFSVGAYAIPALLAIHALFYTADIKENRLASRVIFSALTVVFISAFAHSVATWDIAIDALPFDPVAFYRDGTASVGGGFIGGVLGFALMSFLGHIGVIILSVAIFAIYIAYFFSEGSTLREVGRMIIYGVLTFCAIIEKAIKKLIPPLGTKGAKVEKKELASTRELADDDFFDVDNGMARLEVSGLGIVESRSRAAIEARPVLHEKVYHAKENKAEFIDPIIDEEEDTEINAEPKPRKDILYEDIFTEKEAEQTEGPQTSMVYDRDSADGLFTSDFDPYDLAAAERLAGKASSRTASEPVVTETVSDVSREQYERIKREEEFERYKRQMMEEQRRRNEERRAAQEAPKKSVAFNVGETEIIGSGYAPKNENVSMRVEKFGGYAAESTTSTARTETTEFKTYTVPEESEPASDGLLFEFDEKPAELKLERTILSRESDESHAEITFEDEPKVHSLFDGATNEDEDDEDLEAVAPDGEEEFEPSDEEIPPEKQNPFISEARGMFDMFRREEAKPAVSEPEQIGASFIEEDAVVIEETEPETNEEDAPFVLEESAVVEEEPVVEDEPPFDFIDNSGTVRKIAEVKKPERQEAPKKPNYKNYKFPSIDLLGIDPPRNEDAIGAEINENTRILIETLASFNVTASIKGVDRGPRVTRYEVVPARGVKVNQVTNLFDDIKLALAAEGVRMEAPIPGRSAIGFEIPNKKPKTVRLRELLECEEFQNSTSTTFVCLGKDVAGKPIFGDIAKFPHALVAGATGMGKSVCINSILISMLYKARPDELKLILVDPKKVEFKIYGEIPHLLVPVVTEAKQAAGALMWAVEEMERRYDVIEKHNVRNIQAYNERVAIDPSIGEPLPKIVIVIDELNDLMMQVKDPAEGMIMRIAQKARAAGIHLIIGTQRPDVKVITGTIKANIGTRISCKVASLVDSRTILEMAGAEKLLDKGDMLFKPTDRTDPVRVQGCFVSDDEVEAVMNHLKQFSTGEQYDERVISEINKAAQKCSKEKKGSQDSDDEGSGDIGYYSDQQFLDAVEVAIRSGKVSTSLLQRKLQIGFGKAARFIDGMEEIGIVSEPNGQKPRDVLVTMDEWREKLSRVDLG